MYINNVYVINERMSEADILYLYPMKERVSFTIVAEKHIEQLRNKFDVDYFEITEYYAKLDKRYKVIFTHPIFWVFTHLSPAILYERLGWLERIYEHADNLIGFDVADSDRISNLCADIVNEYYKAVIVPSNFSRKTFINSGVNVDVYVLPHGLNDGLINAKPSVDNVNNFDLRYLYTVKRKFGYKIVLFFLWHSGYRKGADIVANAVRIVQSKRKDVLLVIKTAYVFDPYIVMLRKNKSVLVKGWLSDEELAFLYDLADIVLCPSRGGGFELNALEAVARGKPVVAHHHGCFSDYKRYIIGCDVEYCKTVIPHNHIHIGGGYTVKYEDLADKILYVLDNYDDIKAKYAKYAKEVRERYNWNNIGKKLIKITEKYLH